MKLLLIFLVQLAGLMVVAERKLLWAFSNCSDNLNVQ